jgi:hypothetical protein
MIVGRFSTMYLPPITGILLIDCWNVRTETVSTKQNINFFYQNILNTVETLQIDCVINAMTCADTQTLDPILESIVAKFLHSTEKLDEFIAIAHANQINHWYVAGQSWQMCVHQNDIGLNNLSKLSDLNFYSDFNSFLKIDGTVVRHDNFVNDTLSWKFVPRFGYHLTQGVL